ncbi:MAG: ABC transporter permease [Chitinophagaceae bacterium]|jgi:putative ABC transport system permease protein
MFKVITILWSSFKLALQELKVNKLRTFLTLFGITFGIFCIIIILTVVGSLEKKINDDLKELGTNTIYIDKWNYSGGQDYPWWKYIKRPEMKYEEAAFVKEKTSLASEICFFAQTNANTSFGDNILNSTTIYATTESLNKIHEINIGFGRFFTETEFERGIPVGVFGYDYAEMLFGDPQRAIGKTISMGGKSVFIVGVLKKQGKSLLGGFDYEHSLLIPYRFFATVYNVKFSNPFIMVKGKQGVNSKVLSDELKGVMRQLRRLSPVTEDNFSLNDINEFGAQISQFFGSVKLGGWFIAFLSLLVGGFSVANIMFVTVRERTSQIGLKKAIGAKKSSIILEFLLESSFLCFLGGLIGLFLVWIVAAILSAVLPFSVFLSSGVIILAFSICLILGVLAGIIPATIAAKMDPVVAIRTK